VKGLSKEKEKKKGYLIKKGRRKGRRNGSVIEWKRTIGAE
jgi:hypothetical protein